MISKNISGEDNEKENSKNISIQDPIKALIENYKKHIETTHLKGELYKWKLINKYSGRPDTDAVDFTKEIKSIKFTNLIYAMGIAVINQLATAKPEELRALFKYLFDESKDLTERVKLFNTESLKLYRSVEEKLQHHQDERSIATYLTFHNPEKYTFYKSAFYKKYCQLLGIKEAKKNEKYAHYLTLIKQLIEDYIIPDKELIQKVKSLIPEYYDGINHNLLAQDILFQMLGTTEKVNYWIFQGSSKVYDVVSALKNQDLTNWSVNAHDAEIKPKDKVILWLTGQNKGCYALAEVTSNVYEGMDEEKELKYYSKPVKNEIAKRVKIKITTNLAATPITQEQINAIPELANLKTGNPGTNFSATQAEYAALLKLTKNRQPLEQDQPIMEDICTSQNTILYGPPGTGKTYSTIDKALEVIYGKGYLNGKSHKELHEAFNSLKEQGQIQFTTFHQSFSYEDFVEGIRPIPPGKGENVSDQLIYDVEPGIFKSICETAIGGQIKIGSISGSDLKKARYYKMSLGGLHKQELHEWCLENDYVALGWGGNNDYSKLKNNKDWNAFKKYFNDNHPDLVEKSRFNIQALYAFLGMKRGDIVLATLGNHIVDAIGVVDGDYEWSEDKTIEYSQFRKVKWLATNLKAKPDKFIRKKISQQSIYEFNKTDIKSEAFESLLGEGEQKPQNYVLIIDEINRGNVASIFGELITLLEPDKRLGAENELTVTLPYSRDSFGVPANLHVIGTMNTADRSVEALDTALRRRFSFIEMMPDYDVLDKILGQDFEVEGIVVREMLKTINKRLELLLDRDHQIGHAWFLSLRDASDSKEELEHIFRNKILPLMQEFFYADYGKIGLVLGKGFVEIVKEASGRDVFAAFEYENGVMDQQTAYRIRGTIGWDHVKTDFGPSKSLEGSAQGQLAQIEFNEQ